MSKVVIVTNIPAPYRVDLFYYMQNHVTEHEFHVIYTNRSEDNRQWNIDEEKLLNSHILESKVIKIQKEMDNRYIHLPANIGKTLSEIKPDVVIAFEYNPAALQSLLWCRLHGAKFIHLTDGTLYSERNISKVQKLSRKLIIKSADACIASSSKAKEKLLSYGIDEDKIFLSLLSEDTTVYENIKREPVAGRILYVGSMIKRKGLDLLIQSLPYVDCEYTLHMVGNGSDDEEKELKQLALQLGVSDKIHWCGFKENEELLKEYMEASLFVLPSREDCFGMVLLEAFCARIPIIASHFADGAYDIIKNGINGFIVNPYEYASVGGVLTDALLSQDIAEGANKNSIDKFRFENTVKGYLEAIDFAGENHTE